ncbi:hypothetical protein Tco_0480707 [Tanacetum coccineum]
MLNSKGNRVVHDISKSLPLGGPPGQVTIQTQYFFNKDLEYLVSGDKERRNALSISKLKVAYYPDFGLKELVPSLWIESERDYDISVAYGISHWWFKRKEFYITRHIAPSNRSAVRYHMKILSVASSTTYLELTKFIYLTQSTCGGELVTRLSVEELALEDYTIVHKPRAIIYIDRNNQKTMIRETKVHKFSNGTLMRILEKLDVIVKDYVLFKFNPGMEHRIWSEDDKRRSQ